jgi:hypothetical protein
LYSLFLCPFHASCPPVLSLDEKKARQYTEPFGKRITDT